MDAKTQQQHAETFHGLHMKGDPLILFNAWDVATANAIAKTSPAVATSSGAVTSALGYADGEDAQTVGRGSWRRELRVSGTALCQGRLP
jgi:2-methylisocitrate lyase-like PEP mutase family enzyme